MAENAVPMQAISVSSTRPDLRLPKPLASLTTTEAAAAVEQYRLGLLPAGTDAAVIPLSRLSVHYWQPDRPVAHWQIVVEDFRSGLSRFPLDLIEDACRMWREATDPPNRFFPKPGELIALIEPRLTERYSALKTLLQIAGREPEPEPPSDADKAEVAELIRNSLPMVVRRAELSGNARRDGDDQA